MSKVRFGIIGVGAQGGAYAGFLTGKAGFPGMPAPECPPHCELGALCDIDPEKKCVKSSMQTIRFIPTGKRWLHPER